MSPDVIGMSILVLALFLVLGMMIRFLVPVFQTLFLPSSIIGGFLALLIGPQVLGRLLDLSVDEGSIFKDGLIPNDFMEVWSTLPGLLINLIFAGLFLGKKIPSPKKMWNLAGPQITFGMTLGWGMYVIGLLLALFVLNPFFGLPYMAGVLLEIGFEGGHGTAAGLRETFSQLDFEEGTDIALGLATVGIIAGTAIGMVLINYGIRKNKTQVIEKKQDSESKDWETFEKNAERESAGELTVKSSILESLTLHVAFFGLAVVIGYGLLQGLILLESVTWGDWTGTYVMEYVPVFPLAMLGSVLIQLVHDRFSDKYKVIDRGLVNRIQGFALDVLIISSIASLSLSAIGEHLVPFLILAGAGILWTLLAFIFIAPRVMPDYWFERAIGHFGQAIGMTATGLLLVKVVDPDDKSPATDGFGYTQLVFEPFLGGGLFTAASVILVSSFGPVPILIFTAVLFFFWLCLGIFHFGRQQEE
ncbi:sodium/glutamate symporter [Bacillus sp. FJAT-27251]|uniref:sodium/glutamate symporter n=1 Tax=Bacillus sp. FJAT-27251 TaxID=1684142 RepID=UPI0006A7D460|nr:sodium/glutamate symporter [Bacillus sp. FJAT-27251]